MFLYPLSQISWLFFFKLNHISGRKQEIEIKRGFATGDGGGETEDRIRKGAGIVPRGAFVPPHFYSPPQLVVSKVERAVVSLTFWNVLFRSPAI